jgi:hypothetical protein
MDKIRRIMKLAHAPGDYFADYNALMAADFNLTVDLTEYNEELKAYDIIYAISAPMYDYDDAETVIIAHVIMDVLYKFKLQYLIPENINPDIKSILNVANKLLEKV